VEQAYRELAAREIASHRRCLFADLPAAIGDKEWWFTTDTEQLFYDENGARHEVALGSAASALAVSDGTTNVDPTDTISFDPAFFDVTDAGGGEAEVTFVGPAGSLVVTDGVTDVDPTETLRFDADFFEVNDLGSDTAEVTFIGATGSDVTDGTTTVTAPPSIEFDPDWFDVTDSGGDAAVTLVTSPLQGNIWPVTHPPAVSQWTWENQGGATAQDNATGSITISRTTETGSIQMRSLLRSLISSTDFDIKFGVQVTCKPNQTMIAAMILRESSTGKMLVTRLGLNAGAPMHDIWNMTNNTTYGTNHYNPASGLRYAGLSLFYMRYSRVSSGQILCYYSLDGQNWFNNVNVTATSPFTSAPNQFGWGVHAHDGNIEATLFSLQGSEA
jgi:hypothetical protein